MPRVNPAHRDAMRWVCRSRRRYAGTNLGTRDSPGGRMQREMPTDVVQAILGHASLQTTSIYVRTERRRMLEAAARYYADHEE